MGVTRPRDDGALHCVLPTLTLEKGVFLILAFFTSLLTLELFFDRIMSR